MPSSKYSYIPNVMQAIEACPRKMKILDVGSGFGKYGVLCREYIDLIPSWCELGINRFKDKNWGIRIDSVEPTEMYITPLYGYIYDNVYRAKIEDIVDSLSGYDIVLFIGVIEHLAELTAKTVIKKLQSKSKSIIIVTPNGYKEQEEDWDNPLETHRSGWDINSLQSLGFNCSLISQNTKILGSWQSGK